MTLPPSSEAAGALCCRLAALLLLSIALIATMLGAVGPASASHAAGPQWPYQVYRPSTLSKAQPVPLVIIPTQDINYMITHTLFNQAADRGGFVVAYAQIIKSYDDVAKVQGESVTNPYPDMLFLSDLIDTVTASENIDPGRVFMAGFSLGGSTSFRAGCVLAPKLAGVASVGGVVTNPKCVPSRPVSVYALNGTGDPTYRVAPSGVDLWKGFDGCAATPTSSSTSGAVTVQTWGPCKAGSAVKFATVAGGQHVWFGEPGLLGTKTPDGQIDATSVISSFFLSVPHASKVALTASIASVVVKPGKPRSIVVRLVSNAAETVHASLAAGKRIVYSHSFASRVGTTVLRLRLSSRVKTGSYKLTLALKGASGAKVLQRAVHVPR
jgi:poly(3-hydroxybutyrate) depolymerase